MTQISYLPHNGLQAMQSAFHMPVRQDLISQNDISGSLIHNNHQYNNVNLLSVAASVAASLPFKPDGVSYTSKNKYNKLKI